MFLNTDDVRWVFYRLPLIANEDDKVDIVLDIVNHLLYGMTKEDVLAYMKCREEVNHDLDEETALSRMKAIAAKYKQCDNPLVGRPLLLERLLDE